ncbi:MAG: hypothetical protein AB8H79_16900 [Myxococcota bacterium]
MVLAIAETMFPEGDARRVSVEDAKIVEYLDDLFAEIEPRERIMMRSLFALVEVQSLVFSFKRPSLFSRASPEVRSKNLAGWDKSRLYYRRLVFQAIRSLMLWAYVDNPDVEQSIGVERGTSVLERLTAAGWTLSPPQET